VDVNGNVAAVAVGEEGVDSLPAVGPDAPWLRPLDNRGRDDQHWKMTCVTRDKSAAVVDVVVGDVAGTAGAGLVVQWGSAVADRCRVQSLQR